MQPIIPLLTKEFEIETATLTKYLQLVPDDKFDWKPHEKNMTMKQLAVHLAEIPGWVHIILNTEGIDFAGGYQPTPANSNKELIDVFEKNRQQGLNALNAAKEEDLNGTWTMRSGEQILMSLSKYDAIRHALGQLIHHRAQLGVYFRLVGISLPSVYGPTADNMSF